MDDDNKLCGVWIMIIWMLRLFLFISREIQLMMFSSQSCCGRLSIVNWWWPNSLVDNVLGTRWATSPLLEAWWNRVSTPCGVVEYEIACNVSRCFYLILLWGVQVDKSNAKWVRRIWPLERWNPKTGILKGDFWLSNDLYNWTFVLPNFQHVAPIRKHPTFSTSNGVKLWFY